MSSTTITATHMADPGCPWAYCALPSITALRWRYGGQLDWRIVTIGLADTAEHYERRGYTAARTALTPLRFMRFGMPFVLGPRARVIGTGRACRAVVAARELFGQDRAYTVLRALSIAWFTTVHLLDTDEGIDAALAEAGVADAAAIVAAIGSGDVETAYQGDRAEVRSAEGSPSSLQERTAQTDGPERYSAPTLVFQRDGRRLEAGGHQSLTAYDVLVANLAPDLEARPAAASAAEALAAFEDGLVTREVATLMAGRNDDADDAAATAQLLELVGDGEAERTPFGTHARWRANA